jgi:hypothetical protein
MGALTETEIFDRMTGCLKAAVSDCIDLSKAPRKGSIYDRLRKNLRLAGNCCRQAAQWREDARWLNFDKQITHCIKLAGDWLRGYHDMDGARRLYAADQVSDLFFKLSQTLAALHNLALNTRDKATQRTGMILPIVHRESRTQGRSVAVKLPSGMKRRASGLIVPQSAAVH